MTTGFEYASSIIEKERRSQGLSKSTLARRALMTEDALGKSLRGDRVLKADEAARLCWVLEIPFDELITHEDRYRMQEAKKPGKSGSGF